MTARELRDEDGAFPVARIAALIAAVALAIVIAQRYEPYTWLYGDGRFYVNALDTLTHAHTLRQEHYAASWYRDDLGWNRDLASDYSNLAAGSHGEHWPKHPWLLPVVAWPFHLAFGLVGTLVSNALALVVATAAAASWARRTFSTLASLAAAVLFVFAAGPAFYLYDFQLDPLLLALVLGSLAAASHGAARIAGASLALAIVARPTVVLVVPALAMELHASGGRRAVRHAVFASMPVFVASAAVNTFMFGRPWWTGYNRVLVRHDGVLEIESHADAFGFDFVAGLRRDLLEGWSLWARDRVMLWSLPGACVLVRSRTQRARTLVALATLVVSVLLFAKYRWASDRFNWPALALFVPSLAAMLDLVVTRVPSRLRARFDRVSRGFARAGRVLPGTRSSVVASVLAAFVVLVSVGVARRVQDESRPWRIEGERALRDADVVLGARRCDFLAWENMAWECGGADATVIDRTGLLLPAGTRAGGQRWMPAFRLATGRDGTTRSVTWERVATQGAFAWEFAAPDHEHAKLDVSVAVDDRLVDHALVHDDLAPTARCIALPGALASGHHRVRIVVVADEARRESVALRGGFVAQCRVSP